MITTKELARKNVEMLLQKAFNNGTVCCKSWPYGVLQVERPVNKNAHSRNYGPFKTKNKKHVSNLTKIIQIKDFSTSTISVLIGYSTGIPQNTCLRINRADFELWLYQTCRLDWCITELPRKYANKNKWPYEAYGITVSNLMTFIIEQNLLYKII
ncbi:MAG: hypothetical protein JST70_09895 [Bacteroidetes bacterium]|nr:hypothetical protein [Bacteroidota bacterium]